MKFFKINGKSYPAQGGWSALKMFAIKHDPQMEFHELFDYLKGMISEKTTNQMVDDCSLLLFCFIHRGCEKENQEFDLTINDILDSLPKLDLKSIIELLYESYGVAIEQKKQAKKKPVAK